MAENSNIEWTTHTFNPWIGCTKVSDGCKFCYAEQMMDKRYGTVNWGRGNPRKRTSAANWKLPLRWNRQASGATERPRVFCASLADVFDSEVPTEWRDDLWDLIAQTPNLDWLLLTKRPENIGNMIPWADGQMHNSWKAHVSMWPNVWLGTSVENQKAADERIPHLLKVPAKVRFLSCEPLLGPVDLSYYFPKTPKRECPPEQLPYYFAHARIHWVIAGGESGPNARPMHPDYARLLRDQCVAAGVNFHFKQWGEWLPGSHVEDKFTDAQLSSIKCHLFDGDGFCASFKVGKKKAGRLLDGQTWDEFPTTN